MTRRHENESLGPAHDPAPYPREWTPEQRTRAYWHCVMHADGTFPSHTQSWYAVLSQAEHRSVHVKDVLAHANAAADDDEDPTLYLDPTEPRHHRDEPGL